MLGLIRYLEHVLRSGYRSSAISPLLWLNALVTITCLIGSFLIQSTFRWAPFSIAVVVVLYTLWKYDFLVKKDPRLVQSESFQLESQKLDLIESKGGPITVDPVALAVEPKRIQQETDRETRGATDE